MKTRCVIADLVLLALLTVPPRLEAEVRQWTRASDGKTIPAEFAGMKDERTAKIKLANGQIYEVPLAGLSPDDHAYIKAKENGAIPASGSAPSSRTPTADPPGGAVTITLSEVHLCCRDCEEAVTNVAENETTPVPAGVTLTPNRKEETIVISAPSGEAAQVALRSVLEAGFYGKSDNETVKIADLKPDDSTTDTMVVRNVHLCCGGCVKAFGRAVESVDGVKSHGAETGSTRVTVAGKDFKAYEVMQALREAGFGGSSQ